MKTNPSSLKLAINKKWVSKSFFENYNYSKLLYQDLYIQDYVTNFFQYNVRKSVIHNISIQRQKSIINIFVDYYDPFRATGFPFPIFPKSIGRRKKKFRKILRKFRVRSFQSATRAAYLPRQHEIGTRRFKRREYGRETDFRINKYGIFLKESFPGLTSIEMRNIVREDLIKKKGLRRNSRMVKLAPKFLKGITRLKILQPVMDSIYGKEVRKADSDSLFSEHVIKDTSFKKTLMKYFKIKNIYFNAKRMKRNSKWRARRSRSLIHWEGLEFSDRRFQFKQVGGRIVRVQRKRPASPFSFNPEFLRRDRECAFVTVPLYSSDKFRIPDLERVLVQRQLAKRIKVLRKGLWLFSFLMYELNAVEAGVMMRKHKVLTRRRVVSKNNAGLNNFIKSSLGVSLSERFNDYQLFSLKMLLIYNLMYLTGCIVRIRTRNISRLTFFPGKSFIRRYVRYNKDLEIFMDNKLTVDKIIRRLRIVRRNRRLKNFKIIRFVHTFYISVFFQNPEILGLLLANLVKRNIRSFYFLFAHFSRILSILFISSKLNGLKVQFKGRLGTSLRKKTSILVMGTIPSQTIDSCMKYNFIKVNTIYGVCGIKMWYYY